LMIRRRSSVLKRRNSDFLPGRVSARFSSLR
jgi:hypothetical protein